MILKVKSRMDGWVFIDKINQIQVKDGIEIIRDPMLEDTEKLNREKKMTDKKIYLSYRYYKPNEASVEAIGDPRGTLCSHIEATIGKYPGTLVFIQETDRETERICYACMHREGFKDPLLMYFNTQAYLLNDDGKTVESYRAQH